MHCILVLNEVHFGAKRKPFWCKTQGVLVLNASRFDAKRQTKCCQTQNKKHKYPLQWYK